LNEIEAYSLYVLQNGLKQENALSPLLFDLVSKYARRKVQDNEEDLELNGTNHLLVYADVTLLT
jgi:hypothetical protein